MHDGERIMELQDRCDLLEKTLAATMAIVQADIPDITREMLDAWNECQANLKELDGGMRG